MTTFIREVPDLCAVFKDVNKVMKYKFAISLFFTPTVTFATGLPGSALEGTGVIIYFLALLLFLIISIIFTLVYRSKLKKRGLAFKWEYYLIYLMIISIVSFIGAVLLFFPFLFLITWI